MATQRERNIQRKGGSSYVGKDPFDGLLKKVFANLSLSTELQRDYLKRINNINANYPHALVGKNPYYIALAFIRNSSLSVNPVGVNDLLNDEIDPKSNFTIIRYTLWLRAMEDQLISPDVVPINWINEISMTREAYSYDRVSVLEVETDEE